MASPKVLILHQGSQRPDVLAKAAEEIAKLGSRAFKLAVMSPLLPYNPATAALNLGAFGACESRIADPEPYRVEPGFAGTRGRCAAKYDYAGILDPKADPQGFADLVIAAERDAELMSLCRPGSDMGSSQGRRACVRHVGARTKVQRSNASVRGFGLASG